MPADNRGEGVWHWPKPSFRFPPSRARPGRAGSPISVLDACILRGCPPPKPSFIAFVTPEVVQILAVLGDKRNAGVGIEDGQQVVAEFPKRGIGFEFGFRDFVLRFNPLDCPIAQDIFQPTIWIVGRRATR